MDLRYMDQYIIPDIHEVPSSDVVSISQDDKNSKFSHSSIGNTNTMLSTSNRTSGLMDAEQFEHEGALLFHQLAQQLKDLNRNLSARVLCSLSEDSNLCKFIYESPECKTLLLDQLYHKATQLKWPLNMHNEARALSERAIENLLSYFNRQLYVNNTDLCYITVTVLSTCVKVRKELITLIKLSSAQMTVQSENVLSDTVHNINVYFQELDQLNIHHETLDKLFFSGVIHLTLETMNVMQSYLNFQRHNNKYILGPCPFIILKLAENTAKFLQKHLLVVNETKTTLLFETNDVFKTIVTTLGYYSKVDIMNNFSCNCMARKRPGNHIVNDSEIGDIIIYACRSLHSFCKLLKGNLSGEYFIKNNHFNEVIEILMDTVMNVSIPKNGSKNDLILSVLETILEIFSYLFQYYNVDVLNERIYQIMNSEILAFLSRVTTIPFLNSFRSPGSNKSQNNSEEVVLFKICKNSLSILKILMPTIKSNINLINILIEAKLPQRLIVLLQKLKDVDIISLVCDNLFALVQVGVKNTFLENNIMGTLENLTMNIQYDLIRGKITSIVDELKKANSFTNETPMKQNGFQTIDHVQSTDSTLRVIPWLRKNDICKTNRPFFEITNIPSENENISPNISGLVDKKFVFSSKENQNNSSLNKNTSSSFDGNINQNNFYEKGYNQNFRDVNIKKSLSISEKSKLNHIPSTVDKSFFSRVKNVSHVEGLEQKPKRIFAYMSNFFKSRNKVNKTQT